MLLKMLTVYWIFLSFLQSGGCHVQQFPTRVYNVFMCKNSSWGVLIGFPAPAMPLWMRTSFKHLPDLHHLTWLHTPTEENVFNFCPFLSASANLQPPSLIPVHQYHQLPHLQLEGDPVNWDVMWNHEGQEAISRRIAAIFRKVLFSLARSRSSLSSYPASKIKKKNQ